MSETAFARIKEDRKEWRKSHPFGMWARPTKFGDKLDLMRWEAVVPGKEGTDWEGGEYKLTITFTDEYPTKPPKVKFMPPVFHPNVYPSGTICLSILDADKHWKPEHSLSKILTAIQDLLDNPNVEDPAQLAAYVLLK
ncbi:ubiquitin-conjugating enzyme E2 I [Pseudohyphozyma bogoriensis]|nr:ubiquitin-conjugating enzyme E2 I [Pseudohyphozyma bogoriensis]